MLEKSVGEESCQEVLQRGLATRCSREVSEKSVGDKCCREVLVIAAQTKKCRPLHSYLIMTGPS